jgi:hypothetical protein
MSLGWEDFCNGFAEAREAIVRHAPDDPWVLAADAGNYNGWRAQWRVSSAP